MSLSSRNEGLAGSNDRLPQIVYEHPKTISLVDPRPRQKVMDGQGNLRAIGRRSAELGIPTPGFMVSLAYFDGDRSAWLPANLIQAQRDYFGAHAYERIDEKGQFHAEWRKE